MTIGCDVLIFGSGFGGSLLSLVLTRLGLKCVLIDKGSHPRFAIGESSTPLADFILRDLAKRYDLPEILPLASFGTWQENRPELRCGLKRGFTYFGHESGKPFRTDDDNANQLLVAASSNDFDSDTHWHRSDVDAFLFKQAREAGVVCFENAKAIDIDRSDKWTVQFELASNLQSVKSKWCIDASGSGQVLLKHLRIPDETHRLQTNTHAVYSHWNNVRPFADVLTDQDIDIACHPYPCDSAALHHLFDDAWMWNLRFTNGTTSAGLVMHGTPKNHTAKHQLYESSLSPLSPARNTATTSNVFGGEGPTKQLTHVNKFAEYLDRYPSLQNQFANATPVESIGLRSTGRLQRFAGAAAGDGWFALPNTVGFIDPLHSTGIAHTLSAVERIANVFESNAMHNRGYDQSIRTELLFIDELVSGCYASLGNFELFTTWTMLYFAAAHSCEMRRVAGETAFENGFLGAAIPELRDAVRTLRPHLDSAIESASPDQIEELKSRARDAIAPFNAVGLLNDDVKRMYSNTAPPRA